MTQEPPPRLPPQSAVQATGQVAESVIAGLKQQPALLAIVVLNVVMMVALFWFIGTVQEAGRTNREQLFAMLSRCLNHQGINR